MIGADLHERREHARSKAKDILSSALNIAAQLKAPVETECVLDMTPYDAIIETAKAKGGDLIVMASHGRSGLCFTPWQRNPKGSDTQHHPCSRTSTLKLSDSAEWPVLRVQLPVLNGPRWLLMTQPRKSQDEQ